MARINTNVASLIAQRGLSKSQDNLNGTLQRLSSGLRRFAADFLRFIRKAT